MTPDPPVSIVIPTYDRAALIPRAVDSVLPQLRPPDELVVIDDGSTDSTREVLAAYGERIAYRRSANRGVSAARNLGVRTARHPLVGFLDSDDEWVPGKLDIQRQVMRAHPEVVLSFSNFATIDVRSPVRRRAIASEALHGFGEAHAFSDVGVLPSTQGDFVYRIGAFYRFFLAHGPILQVGTLLARRDVLLSHPFSEDLSLYEDDDLLAKVSPLGPVAYLDFEGAIYHSHPEPRLVDQMGNLQGLSAWIRVLERNWGSDPDFLADHGPLYARIYGDAVLTRAKGMLVSGRRAEARQDIARLRSLPAFDVPRAVRLAAATPPGMLGPLLALRRGLKRLFRRGPG